MKSKRYIPERKLPRNSFEATSCTGKVSTKGAWMRHGAKNELLGSLRILKFNGYSKGFNLIELIIVVTIIGILAAIAYPAYQNHIIRSRRADGQTALMNMAALMEHYYTENNTYIGANPTTLGITNTSQEGYYTVSVSASTATTYTLSATPVTGGPQTSDTTCGTLTITNTNTKGPTPSTCWN